MTTMRRRAGLSLVKASAAGLDRLRRPRAGVVVLLYHRVGGSSDLEVDLPATLFAEQMAALAERTRPVALDDALAALAGPAADGPPRVVVTFDDGTADFAEVALPILERYSIPATLYLATAFADSGEPFPAGGRPLSWAALRDTLSTGLVTVGSHTHTHALLDRVPVAVAEAELDRSRELIAERLGAPADHFAYPKALPGTAGARAAVARRFRSAALAGTAANRYGDTDPYALARSPVQRSDGMRWFRHKLAGGLALEDTLRNVLNRRRFRGATT